MHDQAPTPTYFPTGLATDARPIPDRIGRYRINRFLGAGGFGRVFLGFDDLLERFVAIKVPHPGLAPENRAAEAYLAEARLVAGLDHPHIVPVYDVGSTDDCPCYIVSKYIDGPSLAARLRNGRLSVREAIDLAAAAADALHFAHHRGIVHRDVKPGNILLDQTGKAFVGDFGLALRDRDVGSGPRYAGTPAYMSPEQVFGEGHRVDGRSDVFSLGVVLYELLTGRRPFIGDSQTDLSIQITETDPPPPGQFVEGLPPDLERCCLKALAKRTTDRYATAAEFAADLRLALAESPRTPRPPAGLAPEAAQVVPRGLRAFEAADADFFPALLPGPRDRRGLPDAVRFWLDRLDPPGTDEGLTVGLIYGPSGCGKTSLVKAGILPRLPPGVRPVYVEASADLETRLRLRLAREVPDTFGSARLASALASLRLREGAAAGETVLLVLDQFEQWLHAHPAVDGTDLVRALRQCDGVNVQCLILVRDDFWMAATRFMRALEVPVVEGRTAAAVDLFTPAHARQVLEAFGRGYGTLPPAGRPLAPAQAGFLERAVAELAVDGWVIPVRLALFADLVKRRPWTGQMLKELGGAVGIGVKFLDELFLAATAPPEHRLHHRAVQATLAALLPGPGTDIRGHVRSRAELLAASGYQQVPARFDDLMRVLTVHARLLTPTAPDDPADHPTDQGGYQLTHDYLVPPIREWLDRAQRETHRGRAYLRLAERGALWQARPERRQLPSLPEWLSIRLFTRPRAWTDAQRRMMRAAARRHAVTTAAATAAVAVFLAVGLLVRGHLERETAITRADGLVARLLDANIAETPGIIADLDRDREWAGPNLERALADPGLRPDRRLRARLALLPTDPQHVGPLREALLAAPPDDFQVIRDALSPHRADLVAGLWGIAADREEDPIRRFRAAAALATYDRDNPGWAPIAEWVAGQLVSQPALLLPGWVEAFRPVRVGLVPHLTALLRTSQVVAAHILADYAADQPGALAEAVGDSGPQSFAVLFDRLGADPATAVPALADAFARSADGRPARRANLAVALLRLGDGDRLWELLKTSSDPGPRSFAIDRLPTFGADPNALFDRFRVEPDPSVRAALLMALGGFDDRALPQADRALRAEWLRNVFRTDCSAAVHAAAGWLLTRWREPLPAATAAGEWRKNSIGMTMVRIPGPVEFVMGAPPTERGTQQQFEKQHRVRIEYSYEIAATEVTVGQFRRFLIARKRPASHLGPDSEVAVTSITWYEAAEFCNWLSELEGCQESDLCYQPNADGRYTDGMRVVAGFRAKKGYRLPTEAEWEYACRGGATTSRCYGEADELLPRYAWFALNSTDGPAPVGKLLPNAFGLFDMHGNVSEWCHNRPREHALPVKDQTDVETVLDINFRTVRGGRSSSYAAAIRSARRLSDRPSLQDSGGFRVGRDLP